MNKYYVYELLFPNKKRYIGITRREPSTRWKNGYGYCGQMVYKAIVKYGWNNIKHNILYYNLSKNDACNKERELIKKYNTTNIKYGYNLSDGGDCGCCMSGERHWTYNKPRPESTKQKISNNLTGRYMGKDNPHHTPVEQLTLEGKYIRTWDSFADIKRELGYDHAHIVDCCKGRRHQAYNYKWRYALQKL